MSFSLYLDKIVGREVSFQAAAISGVTDFDFPDTSWTKYIKRTIYKQ